MSNGSGKMTIQLRKDELQAVLGIYEFQVNTLSPLMGLLGGIQPASVLTDEIQEALADPAFNEAIDIASSPDLIVNSRIGGGSTDLQEMKLCRKKELGNTLALIVETEKDEVVIKLFENSSDYLGWFISNYAGKNKETVANYIPPTTGLEEFLFMLHAVDAFRIASFKGMLNYAAGQKPVIKLNEFSDTMYKSVKSKDIRWLLPAFIVLTPGLDEYKIDLTPGKSSILMERNFMAGTTDPVTGEGVLTFGEAGRNMGVEFYRTWLLGAGFEIIVSAPSGKKNVSRMFIAPTALANHFVRLETGENMSCMVNHQAFTVDQLEAKMNEIFDGAMSIQTVPLKAEQTLSGKPQASKAQETTKTAVPGLFCSSCGASIKPGAKFCSKCGTKI